MLFSVKKCIIICMETISPPPPAELKYDTPLLKTVRTKILAVHSALLQKPQLLGPNARKMHAGRREMKEDQLVGSESKSNRKKGH